MSVDLVGSTAFKAKYGEPDPSAERSSPNPAWVDQIRHFYRDFPDKVIRNYKKLEKPEGLHEDSGAPKIWKTIGDEIVFCCRLTSLDHLSVCVRSFIQSLEEYGRYLDSVGKILDLSP